MSMVVRTGEALRLDELAEIANREHLGVEQGLADAVEHAFMAGDALRQAYDQTPEGAWEDWLAANFTASRATAALYRRMATYRETLRAHNITSINSAQRLLAASGLHLKRVTTPALPSDQVEEIRRLRSAGLTQREIADVCGVSYNSVQRYLDPLGKVKQQRQNKRYAVKRKAERAALVRVQRDTQMRGVKGPLGVAYEHVRKTAEALQEALSTEATSEMRVAVESALHNLYKAEDKIIAASKAKL